MDTAIPYRITLYGEKPIERSFWFETRFTNDWQSIQTLLVIHLKENRISYIRVLGKLWFLFNGAWCSYDYEATGDSVRFYMLEYIQN